MTHPVVIVSMGACTPVGRDAWSTAAAVRAKISGMAFHPFMTSAEGEPVQTAAAPWLDPDMCGPARLTALLLPAIEEALAGVTDGSTWNARAGRSEASTWGLSLGLPGARGNVGAVSSRTMADAVQKRHPGLFGSCAAFSGGNASGLMAMEAAVSALQQGRLDACLVAGVDSYLDPRTLAWLECREQWHGVGPTNNSWGFIPGEAAGALLLTRLDEARRFGWTVLGRILSTGQAHETMGQPSGTVCTGTALTQALAMAVSTLQQGSQVSDIYCDLNGEPQRADEFGFAALRLAHALRSPNRFVAPADCWGDVGAAGGPLHAILAVIARRKAYAHGSHALIWASSAESGERRAALIDTQHEGMGCR